MKKTLLLGAAAVAASGLCLGRLAAGQTHAPMDGAMLHLPSALTWKAGPASLPPGAQFAVLEGDPTREGPFTMRLKMPAGYRIAPHTHPKVERLTVISGTFRLGMGARFEESGLRDMPAGTYGYWPPGMKHFAAAKEETVVQLHGMGPWQITYLNPADDPRLSGASRP